MVSGSKSMVAEESRSDCCAEEVPANRGPRSLAIAQRGVETSGDFTQLMSALMGDLLEGSIDASVGNAVVNAGGKMLKVVELRLKYGTKQTAPGISLIG